MFSIVYQWKKPGTFVPGFVFKLHNGLSQTVGDRAQITLRWIAEFFWLIVLFLRNNQIKLNWNYFFILLKYFLLFLKFLINLRFLCDPMKPAYYIYWHLLFHFLCLSKENETNLPRRQAGEKTLLHYVVPKISGF